MSARTAARSRTLRQSEFALYVGAVAGVAAGALTVLPWMWDWQVDDPVLLVALSVFALAGELLPIPVPRRRRARAGHDLGRVRVRDPAALRRLARPRSCTWRAR